MSKAPAIERDWLSKTLAGALLGLTLAFACSVVFARLATPLPAPIRAQLAMWMVIPIWLCVLSSSFFFQSGKRAWLWLVAANGLLIGCAAVARVV